ncbi:VOC family protein [Caldibacillus lycopersici]|uniref:VOC family protein n=1 Tax=Perspicuibacillus lycopersici TaxID=1325689 RepID=A0AAE3LPF2_9BACI|nr:VOC family protein [Perspicuibacillus lycopersici]MCU9614892.1 VOC family protein [Perspicuibacillus lycopersici]
MNKAVQFYTNVLDFTVSKQYGENIMSLTHNGLPFILEKAEEANLSTSSNSVVLAIQSTNIQDDFEKLRNQGVKMIFDEPKKCPPGYYFVIEDYSGNQLEVIQFMSEEETV